MKEYNALIKKYKIETLHEEKNRIGSALGDFKDDKVLCLSMHFALSNEVRIQDTIGILSSIGANPLGRNIWLKSLKQNWKMLVTRYGDGGNSRVWSGAVPVGEFVSQPVMDAADQLRAAPPDLPRGSAVDGARTYSHSGGERGSPWVWRPGCP